MLFASSPDCGPVAWREVACSIRQPDVLAAKSVVETVLILHLPVFSVTAGVVSVRVDTRLHLLVALML